MSQPKFTIETSEFATNNNETCISRLVIEIDNLSIELTRLVSDEITEFRMYDRENKIVELTCKNFEGGKRYALVSVKDDLLIMENIVEIHSNLKKQGLFILELEKMDPEMEKELKSLYNFSFWFGPNPMAVLDAKGNYVLKPFFQEITWKPEEELFYAQELLDDTVGNGIYNVNGEKVGEFEL